MRGPNKWGVARVTGHVATAYGISSKVISIPTKHTDKERKEKRKDRVRSRLSESTTATASSRFRYSVYFLSYYA